MTTYFIDVREPDEFAQGHVEGAINVPLSQLSHGALPEQIVKHDHLVVYCRSGNRSATALQLLKAKGFSNLENGISQEQIAQKRQG